MKHASRATTLLVIAVLATACMPSQETEQASVTPPPAPPATTSPASELPSAPLIPGSHWHHVQINSVDPDLSAAFYAKHFDAEIADFPGADTAVKAQDVWLLFTKVDAPSPTEFVTPIWHIGWGAPDPKAVYEQQKELGADFAQPLTDISGGMPRIPPDTFYYMYVKSPDGTWVELNTAQTDDFGHIHIYSADPVAAGEFYAKYFGIAGRNGAPVNRNQRPSFATNGIQIGPSASLYFDQVNMIIYPVEYTKVANSEAWEGLSELRSTRGYVNDHIAIEVPDLDAALKIFADDNIPIEQGATAYAEGIRHAFITGPDNMAIELIEISGS